MRLWSLSEYRAGSGGMGPWHIFRIRFFQLFAWNWKVKDTLKIRYMKRKYRNKKYQLKQIHIFKSYAYFAKAPAVGSLPSTDALKGSSQPHVLWRKVDVNITPSTWRPVSVSAGLARVNAGWLQSNSGSQLGTHFRIARFKNANSRPLWRFWLRYVEWAEASAFEKVLLSCSLFKNVFSF